ncbi:MAG: alcohol dehydrogenase, partial [Pseudomonadales bacterium]
SGQKSLSGSPMSSPASNRKMLEFCARHSIAPVTEEFALTDVNNAIAHLEEGKARYRVVLKM